MRRRRTPTPSRRRSSLTGRERVTITDYKSSDVREPAKARQRARESLQLQIYAMGYEALTGRLPDCLQLHFLDTGLVGPGRGRSASAWRRAASGSRPRPPGCGPATTRRSRTGLTCGYCPFREICPSSVATVTRSTRAASRRSRSTSATRSCRSAGRRSGASSRLTADAVVAAARAVRPRRRSSRPGRRSASGSSARRCPQFREVDLAERLVRVFARLRGMPPPPATSAGTRSRRRALGDPDEIDWAVDGVQPRVRRRACRRTRRRGDARPAGRRRDARDPVELAAGGDDRPLRRGERLAAVPPGDRRQPAGRRRSSRTRRSSPRPAGALGDRPPDAILHVGDDWAADVVGAARAGWRAAYVRRPARRLAAAHERAGRQVVPDLESARRGPGRSSRSERRPLRTG